MLFMLIERFEHHDMRRVYAHLTRAGRGMPVGLDYLGSWVEVGSARCFQLMQCDDLALLQQWSLHWQGSGMHFECVPVLEGALAAQLMARHGDKNDLPAAS